MIMSSISKSVLSRTSARVDKELRASHAGETGAVWIYRGALTAEFLVSLVSFSRSPHKNNKALSVKAFANEHLQTEKTHQSIFENEMPAFRGSYMLLLWMVAGFLTGFIPRILGRNWFFYTIYCVEYFVDQHYEAQCCLLENVDPLPSEVLRKFRQCQQDEQSHRDEAYQAMTSTPSFTMKLWGKIVGKGSAAAVAVAKLI
jgi:ubiquinone biosynthesis monooxygenase Coq7